MQIPCERCKQDKICKFFGHPASVKENKAQNGEWLCEECLPLRMKELDEAIEKLEKALNEDW